MAASIKLFAKPYIPASKSAPLDGATTFAWRFPGVIFAAATVYLLIIFGRRLFDNIWVGWMAGIFYAFDGLSFVQSRTGMNDIYIAFFVVLAFYFLYIFFNEYPKKVTNNLVWLGLASGLAAATKWTGFYGVGIVFAWAFLYVFRRRALLFLAIVLFGVALYVASLTYGWLNLTKLVTNSIETPVVGFGILWTIAVMLLSAVVVFPAAGRKLAITMVLTLAVIPVLVYVLSYSQWWLQGHTWGKFEELHKQIWWYQTGLKAHHDYESKAYTWPFLIRPVWFYVKYEDHFNAAGQKELWIGNIYTMGNPFIWWAGLVALLSVIWSVVERFFTLRTLSQLVLDEMEGLKKKTLDSLKNHSLLPLSIILVGYFGMFLPWTLSPRIMFLYHYLPSVPFLCLALAYVLVKLATEGLVIGDRKSPVLSLSPQAMQYVVTIYLSLVVLIFVYFYPQWSGLPLPTWWVDHYYWLKSWK
jgi:dolichyl-phosphate-mannose--protein O-mannosyl transferase